MEITRFFVFLCLALGVIVVASAQVQFTIDATKQPSPPLRANGPSPGSFTPGHSAALPVRLELLIPTGKLRADGTNPILNYQSYEVFQNG